jgi:hypothetical protein
MHALAYVFGDARRCSFDPGDLVHAHRATVVRLAMLGVSQVVRQVHDAHRLRLTTLDVRRSGSGPLRWQPATIARPSL